MDSVVLVVKGESGKPIAAAQVRDRDLLLRVGGLIAAQLDASKVPKERVEKDGEASWVYVIDLPLLWEIQETLPNLISQLRAVRPAWFEWLEREIPRHHASRNAQPRLAKLSGAEAISWAESNDGYDASPAGHPWHGLRSYQQAGVRWLTIAHGRAILGDDMGLGKAQTIDSIVVTPTGPRAIGSLRPGDRVVDPDGGEGVVTAVYPQGRLPIYRVTFSDGTSTRCCGDHLWMLQSPSQRMRGTFKVWPLKKFMDDLDRPDGRGWRTRKHFVPLCAPVEFDDPYVPELHPYLLGVLIGDGCFRKSTPSLSNPEDYIVEKIKSMLPDGCQIEQPDAGTCDRRISGDSTGYNSNPITEALRGMGLWGKLSVEKSVPEMARASCADRLEFLRGLMDTDGDCVVQGTAIFNTSSPWLAELVETIVRSLGGFTTKSSRIPTYTYKGERRQGVRAYRVNVRLPVNPFTLPQKADRWVKPNLAKAVERVELIGEAEAVCIAVNTRRNLYLTDDYIVTHNTSESLTYLQLAGAERVLVVCPSVVLINWQREAVRWAPAIAFTPIRSQEELATFIARPSLPRRFALSVSWGLLRLVKDALIGLRFDTVVADEIHYASNPESQRTQALLELGMQPWCERRLGLTGTEVRNRPKELWPLLRFVDPLRFRVFTRYGERFCGPKNKKVPLDGKQVTIREYNGVSKIRELNELLRGYAIRREKKQVLTEIPEKTRQVLPVPWTLAEQRTVAVRFERIKKKIGLDGSGEQFWAMGQLTELRKEAGLAKVPIALELIVDTVRSGEPVIVFLYHHEVREALERGLAEAGISSLSIVGETPPKKRDEYVQAFQDGKVDVIIGSTAMKEGVTLHRARITLHVERFWVPADEEQAEDRACRFGQRRAVLNWYLHLEGSMDDYMAKVIEAKREILNALHDRSDHATQRVLLDMIARGEA